MYQVTKERIEHSLSCDQKSTHLPKHACFFCLYMMEEKDDSMEHVVASPRKIPCVFPKDNLIVWGMNLGLEE